MELKRRLDPRVVFIGLYVLAFLIYAVVGLQSVAAVRYEVSGELEIPSVGLVSDVTTLRFDGHELKTPDAIVGSYSQAKNKTLLIGHSTTVFKDLGQTQLGATINYDGQTYRVTAIDMVPKNTIDMREILAGTEQETLMIMTCAGELIGDGDATHRLILTAVR
ncbi:MAG: class F sortase [Candidatus Saccharibacteria bacterium]|nr:class F sortase [Candidatus Saccharibacteria bacterium]